MDTNTKLYKQDFYRWTREQAALLEARQFDALDMANLVEEITSLGISQKHALGSHLKNLVMHLLKWHYQPSERQTGHSWRSSIYNARDDIAVILEDSPGLRREVSALRVSPAPCLEQSSCQASAKRDMQRQALRFSGVSADPCQGRRPVHRGSIPDSQKRILDLASFIAQITVC
jgi:Domain of unknown function DUF29